MKIISDASESVLTILRPFSTDEKGTRWSHYCVETNVSDGILVFNHLTRELILLTNEEYENFGKLDYLKQRWFVVPQNTKEKEMADLVKLVLTTRQPKPKEITSYTIFTTTDCNARCFYCFELGRSRVPMSCDTAEKVVQYIKSHCGDKKVKIRWFGGEPLFNVKAIDTISEGLHRAGIVFTSIMISNGYLFDDEIVHRAVEKWNLKKVQIPLDGTEKVYNKVKAYIYRDTNPFEVVMNNISRLLDSNVRVSIRLNMDLNNAEDLIALAEELARRFICRNGFSVYAHHLLKDDTPDTELHSESVLEKRMVVMERLNEKLEKKGLLRKSGIAKKIRTNRCMADSGKAVTILPDGNIGLCDQYTETEFIGHLNDERVNTAMAASWKKRVPEIPECAECFYYLDCVKLQKCVPDSVCYLQFRYEKLRNTQRTMLWEYERWLMKTNFDEDEDNSIC